MGPGKQSGMGGLIPIDWVDVLNYSKATKAVTERWEMYLLIRMSKAYCGELNGAKEVLRMPPIERQENVTS